MLTRILGRLLVLAAAIALTTWGMPDVTVDGGPFTYLWIAVLFAVVNVVLGTVLRLLAVPLMVVTLGLFSLVVNGVLLGVTDRLSDSLEVDGVLVTVLAALVISVVTAVLHLVLPDRD